MRILVIADPHIPIPPDQYGGTERIVHLLCQGLHQQGHRVDLVAGVGSQSYGGRLVVHQAPTLAYPSRAWRKLWFQVLSARLLPQADVVVNFGRIDYLEFIARSQKPLLCQFQNPVSQFELDFVLKRRRQASKTVRFLGISAAQMQQLNPPDLIDVVYNAVQIETFQFQSTPAQSSPYLAFLGRLTQNKGVDIAIAVARAAGIPLKIAGNIPNNPSDRQFFETTIKPQLGDGCEWIGAVNDRQKNEFLGKALALLFPIQWDEPFGIVMAESLACGTPVIATRRASTPEVIDPGKTGFLCDSPAEMVEAVKRIPSLDRRHCRLAAETRFSSEAMVDEYLRAIQRLGPNLP